MWNAEQQIFNLNDVSVYRAVSRVPGQKSARSSAGTTNPAPKSYRDNLGRQPMSIDGKSPRNVAQAAARGARLTGNYRDNRKSSLSSIASSSSASSASGSPSLPLLQPPAPIPTPVSSASIGINSLSQVRSPSFGPRPTPSTARPAPSTARPTPSTARPTPSTARPTPSTARPTPSTARPTPSTAKPPAVPSLRRRTMVPAAQMPPPATPPTPSPPTTPLHQVISPYVPSPPSVSGSPPPSQYISASSSPSINPATPPTPLPQFNALNIYEPRSSSL